MKRTLIQFGGDDVPAPPEDERPSATECPSCGSHFSGDARFCPYDGEPLRAAPDWDPAGDPLIGAVIDTRYEVLEVLGEGGMGTVYRAKHTALGRNFAIKALRRDLSQDSELAVRFIQEAKAAAAVSHPNVVQITDFGTLESGQPYFVMELLEGRALSRIIREHGALRPPRAAHIARQVAEALAAAHAAGVIHRDLKPDNVHVSEAAGDRELIKVLDFGLAKVAGSSRLTRKGMVFGTPHYMSPEQAAGEPIDHRVDIYALGIVLYEMLTGRVPFEADSFMGVLTKHIYMEPPPPSAVRADGISLGPLDRVTQRCLAKKPSSRYATMSELIADLDSAQASPALARQSESAELSSALSGSALDLDPPAIPTRPRWPWVASGGAALALLGLLGVWGLSSNEPSSELTEPSGAAPAQAAPSASATAARAEPPPTPSASAMPPPAEPVRAAAVRPAVTVPKRAVRPPSRPPRGQPKGGPNEIINPWGE